MSTKTHQYAHQSLAACGFAVMDSRIAWRQRPDLWASGQDCACDLKRGIDIEGTQVMTAKLPGLGAVRVLTRSTDMLAQRLLWVTGYQVDELGPEPAPAPAPVPFGVHVTAQKQAAEKLAELRNLAAQEPPTHNCHLRREILKARAELDQMAA